MKKEISQLTEPVKEVTELLSTATGTLIHWTFSGVGKILDKVPKGYFLDKIKDNTAKIDAIIEKKDLPEVVKNTFKKIKEVSDSDSDYWKYFDKLSEKEKNIERFKLMLFSIILMPGGTVIAAGILGNPAMMLYLNAAFLLPKENMPKPVSDLRDSLVDGAKEKFNKVKNYIKI